MLRAEGCARIKERGEEICGAESAACSMRQDLAGGIRMVSPHTAERPGLSPRALWLRDERPEDSSLSD